MQTGDYIWLPEGDGVFGPHRVEEVLADYGDSAMCKVNIGEGIVTLLVMNKWRIK